MHIAVFSDYPWLFILPILMVLAWKNAMGAWRKGVRHAMGAMAKRRPWQKDALETLHDAHGKKAIKPLNGISSGLRGHS